MQALLSRIAGGPELLELTDLPVPVPGPGEILVRGAFASLNYPDALMIEDRYQVRKARPFIPGAEMAGTIEHLGEGVTGFNVGDRVFGLGSGTLAEFAILDQRKCFRLPDGMPLAPAAGMLVTYGTSLHALIDHGQLKPGQTLLVLGAAGGVGIAAVELGKALGARVVAAVSTPEKAEIAKAAGADETLIYPRGDFTVEESRALVSQFKTATGGAGADVIFDPLGGPYAEPALRALAWQGCYLVIGFTAGIPAIKTNLLLLQAARATGVYWGNWTDRNPEAFRAEVAQLLEFWRGGQIKLVVSQQYPLQQAAEGFRALSSRQATGKIVVSLNG